jgi:serine/threonine protein phosphatase PrpC
MERGTMTMTDCAACADERAAGAAFCEVCGNALTSAQAPACPNCGRPGGIGADGYCEHCGMLAGRPRDHIEIDLGAAAAAVTDRGRRHHRNEDALWLTARDTGVDVVVCDGVSASFDPDVASETAAQAAGAVLAASLLEARLDLPDTGPDLPDTGPDLLEAGADLPDAGPDLLEAGADLPDTGPDLLRAGRELIAEAITASFAAVAELARNGDPRRAASNPACTIVTAVVRGPHVVFGWVGDSRAYWLPADGPVEQLTEDDSWATHAIAMGADPQAALRDPKAHAITAWLGADAGAVVPRTGGFTVTHPGHLILCSDGLWNYLTDPVGFAAAIRVHLRGATLADAARGLAELAHEAGGADNITVALIPVRPAHKE